MAVSGLAGAVALVVWIQAGAADNAAQDDAPIAAPGAQEPAATAEEQRAALLESRVLPARVEFENAMGRTFRLVELRVFLDGRQVVHRQAPEGQELSRQFLLWEGPLSSGPHRLVAHFVFRGRNRGPFTYLDAYTVRVESNQSFFAHPDKAVGLTLVVNERADPTAALMSRPIVSMRSDVELRAPQIQFFDPDAEVETLGR
jgi:hypothetical protein